MRGSFSRHLELGNGGMGELRIGKLGGAVDVQAPP